jgi:flavin reductase (DIM6/NTAB) family NADH-FMN oxidoreductase RutF
LIAGAIAHFECEPYAQYDGGDHVIFVGRVVQFSTRLDKDPLIFFRGAYRSLAGTERGPQWPLPMHY